MKRCLLILVTITVLSACAQSPLGRRQLNLFPDAQMNQMGATAFQEMKQQVPVAEDEAVDRYVACVAQAITDQVDAPDVADSWEITVFRDDSANAFALPGGKIGVHTGLLDVAETPDQLATVIGHEVAHVLAEHSNERVSTQFATQAGLQAVQVLSGEPTPMKQQLMGLLGLGAQVGILLPYNRIQETEADLLGLDLMAQAGFDPRASVALWRNMAAAGGEQPPEFLSTHPGHANRIADLQARIPHALKFYEQARQRGLRPDCQPPEQADS